MELYCLRTVLLYSSWSCSSSSMGKVLSGAADSATLTHLPRLKSMRQKKQSGEKVAEVLSTGTEPIQLVHVSRSAQGSTAGTEAEVEGAVVGEGERETEIVGEVEIEIEVEEEVEKVGERERRVRKGLR